MRARAVLGFVLGLAAAVGVVWAAGDTKVVNMPGASVPCAAGDLLYLDQGPGTDTKMGCTAANLGALAVTSNLADVNNAASSRGNLGIGSAGIVSTGTSGGTLGLLNANKTDSGNDTFSGNNTYSGNSKFTGAVSMTGLLSVGTLSYCMGLDGNNTVILTPATTGNCFPSNAGGGGGGGSPGGSTNDLQYKSGASTFGGITLTNGQIAIGSTGSVPVAATITAGTGIGVTNTAGGIAIAQSGFGPAGGNAVTSIGDVSVTISATQFYAVTSTALTTARTWTLPLATAVTAGYCTTIADAAGGITASNTLTITPQGGHTINKAATFPAIAAANASISFCSNGSNNWQTYAPATIAPTAAGQVLCGSASNQTGPCTVSGDATIGSTGIVTVTKTSGVAFGSFATGTSAANLTGTVACAQQPALTGDATSSAGSCATTLKNTGPGITNATNANVSIDAQGRVTALSSGAVGSGAAVGNTTPVTVATNTTGDQLLQELHPGDGSFNTANLELGLHQSGIISTAATSTVSLKAKLCTQTGGGGTCITLATMTSTATTAASNSQFFVDVRCGVKTTGSSGVLICHGLSSLDLAGASVVASSFTDANTAASSTFDLTGPNFLVFTVAFASASASNGATGQNAYVATQGAIYSISANTPITVTNGTTTPVISLSTVPLTSGGTNAIYAITAQKNLSGPYRPCDTVTVNGGTPGPTTILSSTTETVLWSCKLTANTLGANSSGWIRFKGVKGSATNNSSLKVYFSATNNTSGSLFRTITNGTNGAVLWDCINFGNMNATNINAFMTCGQNGAPTFGAGNGAITAIDTTADAYIVITGTNTVSSANDSVALQWAEVIVNQTAGN